MKLTLFPFCNYLLALKTAFINLALEGVPRLKDTVFSLLIFQLIFCLYFISYTFQVYIMWKKKTNLELKMTTYNVESGRSLKFLLMRICHIFSEKNLLS